MKQAESTVDQFRDRPLEGIPANSNHTIIVCVFTRNTQTQIEMGMPPVVPLRNPLIIEQSREPGTFGKVPVTSHYVKMIARSMAAIMADNTRAAANPNQDVVIKPAEIS